MKGRSVITIAHRLSTIRNADTVAVVEVGRMAEVGSYHQLVGREGGKFSRLVKQQLEDSSRD